MLLQYLVWESGNYFAYVVLKFSVRSCGTSLQKLRGRRVNRKLQVNYSAETNTDESNIRHREVTNTSDSVLPNSETGRICLQVVLEWFG